MKTAHRMSAKAKQLLKTPRHELAEAVMRPLTIVNPLSEDEIDALDMSLSVCLTSIKNGTGSADDAAIVHMAALTCLEFDRQGLECGYLNDVAIALAEIQAAIHRQEQGKSLLLTGVGIATTTTMTDVYHACLRQCTRALWSKVLRAVKEQVKKELVLDSTTARAAGC